VIHVITNFQTCNVITLFAFPWVFTSLNLVLAFISKFCLNCCQFLGFTTIHTHGVHQNKFCFWLIVSVFPFWGEGGRFTLPVDITSVFRAFERLLLCTRGVLAWLSIVNVFFSLPEYICYLYMSFHIFYLCCIWFWGFPLSIHKYMMHSGQRVQHNWHSYAEGGLNNYLIHEVLITG
jgi:hypothetical protein